MLTEPAFYRPVVSVCMATYNGSKHIVKQVASILCQLNSNDELIISDDYSTDDTVSILRDWNDHRIKIIFNNNKPGLVGNFQNALESAKGDVIFLSDQDDIWNIRKVETMCRYLQSADLVVCNCEIVGNNGDVLNSSFFKYRKSGAGFLRNFHKNAYIGCCMAFNRSILTYVLPIPTQVYMHDWWIGLLVELRGKPLFIDEVLMQYVRHGSNASPTGEVSTFSWRKRFSNRFVMIYAIILRGFGIRQNTY